MRRGNPEGSQNSTIIGTLGPELGHSAVTVPGACGLTPHRHGILTICHLLAHSSIRSFSACFSNLLRGPSLVLGAGERDEKGTVQWLMDVTAQWSRESSSLWLRGTGRWAFPAWGLGAEPPLMLTMRPLSGPSKSLTGRDPAG